jgi:hypothetical protein
VGRGGLQGGHEGVMSGLLLCSSSQQGAGMMTMRAIGSLSPRFTTHALPFDTRPVLAQWYMQTA